MNVMKDLGRIAVPLVTPFKENQDVDYESAKEVARRVMKTGKGDSLIVSGTTGEFFTMVESERVELFKHIREAVEQGTTLVAGIGAASTLETIRLARAAADSGYQYVMVVSPYYTKPTQRELLAHFRAVADESRLPVILYNIPIFTGVNLDPDTVSQLAGHENIVGIKEEAELNAKQITEYVNATGPNFAIYCGDDTMVLEAFIQGGSNRVGGVVSGGAHLVGNTIRSMIEAALRGKVDEAAQTQQRLFRLYRVMGQNGRTNPVSLLKSAMRMVGYTSGIPRSPLLPATRDEEKALSRLIDELKIDDKS